MIALSLRSLSCRPNGLLCFASGRSRNGLVLCFARPFFSSPSFPFVSQSGLPGNADGRDCLYGRSTYLFNFRRSSRWTVVGAAKWDSDRSPYETLELETGADEEEIKLAYRRLAKYYHPDVYDGRGSLDEGETAEARFIKIQAAYELLNDTERRQQYDKEHRVNPMKASQAWMDWLMKKRKAFDQRGDMAISAWAEQQQREMNLRARRLARLKMDPDEERRILAKEKKASMENFSNTLRRHTLVLKKRDLMRKKAEEEKNVNQLLAAEGFEVVGEEDNIKQLLAAEGFEVVGEEDKDVGDDNNDDRLR